jgi:hypothetical protein
MLFTLDSYIYIFGLLRVTHSVLICLPHFTRKSKITTSFHMLHKCLKDKCVFVLVCVFFKEFDLDIHYSASQFVLDNIINQLILFKLTSHPMNVSNFKLLSLTFRHFSKSNIENWRDNQSMLYTERKSTNLERQNQSTRINWIIYKSSVVIMGCIYLHHTQEKLSYSCHHQLARSQQVFQVHPISNTEDSRYSHRHGEN